MDRLNWSSDTDSPVLHAFTPAGNQESRNRDYDFLRCIGITCIVLAHVGLPEALFQLRNFDVPLLVILSGLSYASFSSTRSRSYRRYVFDRFVRLVIPTWILLIIMYSSGVLSFSPFNILCSFSLIGCAGIALWIIRILFLAAVVSPVLFSLSAKASREIWFYTVLLGVYSLYTVLLMVPDHANRYIDKMYDVIVLYNIPYFLIYLYGIRFVRFSRRTLKIHCAIALLCFVLIGSYLYIVTGTFVPTQEFKYPPRVYYISYAFFVTLAIYLVVTSDKYRVEKLKDNAMVRFIGSSTLWIFLWHWLFLEIWEKMMGGQAHYLMTFLFVFSATLAAVYLQQRILHFISRRYIRKKGWTFYLNRIFSG